MVTSRRGKVPVTGENQVCIGTYVLACFVQYGVKQTDRVFSLSLSFMMPLMNDTRLETVIERKQKKKRNSNTESTDQTR